jgi:hypothetical protein
MQAQPKPPVSADNQHATDTDTRAPTPTVTSQIVSLGDDGETAPFASPARALQQQLVDRIEHGLPTPQGAMSLSRGLTVLSKVAIIAGLSLTLWAFLIAAFLTFAK